jgi:hypothetical protein
MKLAISLTAAAIGAGLLLAAHNPHPSGGSEKSALRGTPMSRTGTAVDRGAIAIWIGRGGACVVAWAALGWAVWIPLA